MKVKIVKTGIVLLSIMAVLMLAGCPQPTADPLSSDAILNSIRIAGVEPESIGEPGNDWEQLAPAFVYLSSEEMVNAAVEVSADSGASVYLGKQIVGEEPVFGDPGVTFTFAHEDVLYVELFSANHDAYSLYAFQIRKRTPLVSNIALNGVFAQSLGTPAETAAGAAAGEIYFDTARSGSFLPISVATELENTEFRIGIGEPPVFDSAMYVKAANDGFVYLESKSGEDPGDTLYYKLQMKSTVSPASLTGGNITLGGETVAVGASGTTFALAAYAATATTGPGQLATVNRTTLANLAVGLTAPAGLNVEYGWSKATSTEPDNWGLTLTGVHSGAYVGIKVTNPGLDATVYYKFRVLAAGALTTATITGATVDGTAVTPGAQGTAWNTPTTNVVSVVVNGLPKNITISAVAADNASVRYGTSIAQATAPANWNLSGTFTAVTGGTFIGVEVTPENGGAVRYYRFRVVGSGSSEATIEGITINGAAATAGVPGTTWNAALANAPIVVPNLTTTLTASVTGLATGATVEYGYSTAAATAPTWRAAGAFPNAVLGSFIGVRVTAQDGITQAIYRFRFVPGVGSDSSITGITIDGTLYPVGTPRTAAGGGVWGSPVQWYTPYPQMPDIVVSGLPKNITVAAAGAAPNALIKYGTASIKSTTGNDRPNLDRTNQTYPNGVTFQEFDNGWWICVEVDSPDMTSTSTYGFHVISSATNDITTITSANIGGVAADRIPTSSLYISGDTGNPWSAVATANTDPLATTHVRTGWSAALDTADVVLTGLPKDITVNVPAAAIPAGARVLYGSSSANNQQPNNWNTHGQLTNISAGMFVGIQVVSEHGDRAFYRFRITAGAGTNTTLSGVTINGAAQTPGASGTAWTAALATSLVPLTSFSSVTVAATAAEGATVTYGTSAANATVPAAWVSSGTFTNVAPGTFVGVRIVAADGVTTALYRFRLVNGAGTTATLSSASIGGVAAVLNHPVTTPAAGTTFANAVVSTVSLTRAALLNPLTVSAQGSGKVTIRYGVSTATATAPTIWSADSTASFNNVAAGSYIGVEVTSEDFSTVRFYKFQVTLQ
jgi:hypothetical protein